MVPKAIGFVEELVVDLVRDKIFALDISGTAFQAVVEVSSIIYIRTIKEA